ncbi:MAG: selenocysteine-specific translation elongation factor [Anaerolineae bacterium]
MPAAPQQQGPPAEQRKPPVQRQVSPVQRVIATAGHVDHGKSTLVKALTGTDPDRLREEQERQMTIDLGFAFLPLPSGTMAAIVDVPGHRDFIHNMLAGVGGIDVVLLVVAADEGIMPQTREHLSILDLLGVSRGLVVITKADLVEEDWLALVAEEVSEALSSTSLAGSSVISVSATTGQGLPGLVAALDELVSTAPPPPDLGRPRLPIDRVFSLRGHGTIVTGTLVEGRLSVGDQVTLQPSGNRARIRSLQTHGEAIEQAGPGSRTAANLVGIERDDVHRGDVLTTHDWLQPTTLVDVWVRYLDSAPRLLEHGGTLQMFSGTADTLVRVRLLETDMLSPGDIQWAQLICERPLALARRDRFILREASPSTTVGGGVVVDPHPWRRHRRFDAGVAEWLQALRDLPDDEQVLLRLARSGPVPLATVARWLDLPLTQVSAAVAPLVQSGRVERLSEGAAESAYVVASEALRALTAEAVRTVRGYHEQQPLRPGMPREELRRALRLRQAAYAVCLARWLAGGLLVSEGDRVRTPEWRLALAGEDKERSEALLQRLREAGPAGVPLAELAPLAAEAVLQALFALGEAVRLPDDVVLAKEAYDGAVAAIAAAIRESGGLTVAQMRDLLGSNRRSTLALLGYLDDLGLTRRDGDRRVAGRRFPA